MTELCVIGSNGEELGFVTSTHSHWTMDEDGLLYNAEPIAMTITADGVLHHLEMRGRKVLRAIGTVDLAGRWVSKGDRVELRPGRLCLEIRAREATVL
jgi:hypothetical protein